MKNTELQKYVLLMVAIVLAAFILGKAYTYKFRSQNNIVVTGMGETEFVSDLIVLRGTLTADCDNVMDGYKQLEQNKQKTAAFLKEKGIADKEIVFQFVSVNKRTETIYNNNGNYAGERFVGYTLSQSFTIESKDVTAVENVSREITSLIAQGVSIEAEQPSYYYTKLDDVKMDLIASASSDAHQRAKQIAKNAGAGLGRVRTAKMGVFQITGNNTNEEYTYGGQFNTSSKIKKAQITMRVEYAAR